MAVEFHTIGSVAKNTGMTVRALHHYDQIGLVRPSARSETGYRLYKKEDIERLLLVQSLKQLGLSLDSIANVLTKRGVTAQELLHRQVMEASRKLEEAKRLKEKLQFLEKAITSAGASSEDLLGGIRLLETHQLYINNRDIQKILNRWHRAKPKWQPIASELSAYCENAVPVNTTQVQLLTQKWMNIAMNVFQGNLANILDWARMHQAEPHAALHAGLDPALVGYIEKAVALRLEALRRHLSPEELKRLNGSTGKDWEEFAVQGERLLAKGASPKTKAAKKLLARYHELAISTASGDAELASKLAKAYATESILTQGHFISPRLTAYLKAIAA